MNKAGSASLSAQCAGVPKLAVRDVAPGMLVVDTREPEQFAKGHLKGSVNMALGKDHGVSLSLTDGNFGIWLGTMVTGDFVLVADPRTATEALARVGRICFLQKCK